MAFLIARVVSFNKVACTFSGVSSSSSYCRSLRQSAICSSSHSRLKSSRPVLFGGSLEKNSCDCKRSSKLRIGRSEEHTSELQSRENLVCRLLLEKKK